MSTAAVIPPPNSSSLVRRVPRLTARARALLTAMNLHFAGVAALTVLALYFVAHLVLVFQGLKAHDAEALDQQRVELRSAELAAMPLRGLDKKLEASTADADAFYAKRLPYAVSQVAAELGALTKREGVHLTRIQYTYAPVLSGAGALTEVKMDASISGDYRPIVQFINATERDRVFFVINGITLSGQQTGQVNLRLRLTTYLRAPRAGEITEEVLPSETGEAPAGGTR
jgi:hypothetical protein